MLSIDASKARSTKRGFENPAIVTAMMNIGGLVMGVGALYSHGLWASDPPFDTFWLNLVAAFTGFMVIPIAFLVHFGSKAIWRASATALMTAFWPVAASAPFGLGALSVSWIMFIIAICFIAVLYIPIWFIRSGIKAMQDKAVERRTLERWREEAKHDASYHGAWPPPPRK